MHKKTTLKNFKVLQLKTIITMFVLSFLFQGVYAQNNLTLTSGTKSWQPSEVPAMKKMLDVKQEKTAPSNVATPATGVNKSLGAQSDVPMTMPSNGKGKNPTLTMFGTPNTSNAACLFTGSLANGGTTMPTRLFRPGTAGGTCAAPQPFPTAVTLTVNYATHTFTNTTGSAACVTINLTTTDLVNANIQAGAWLGTFNPANMATNYIADPYVSTGTPAAAGGISFSFNLANGATMVIAVWSANAAGTAAGTASDYTLSIDGLCNLCTQPPCVPPTTSTISAVSIPLTEGFDGTVPPAGWFAQNNSTPIGATGWTQGGPLGVFPSHSGAGFISANFNNVGTLGTISNWLVLPNTPPVLKNGDALTFWTRTTTGAFPDRLQVRMNSTNGGTNVGTVATDVGDFTTLLLDINPTYTATGYPIVWTQFTVTLSGLPAAGATGRLAFRYFVENAGLLGANSDFIGIDDVQYSAGGAPSVCAGGIANLKVNITGGSSPYVVVIHPSIGVNFTVSNYISGTLIPVVVTASTSYTLVSVSSTSGCTTCAGGTLLGTATIGLTPTATASVLSQVVLPPVAVTVFNEGFEATVPPPGWTGNNQSTPVGATAWTQGGPLGVFPPHTGTGFISANFNNTGTTGTISNWLICPNTPATIRNGDVIKFWTRTTTGAFPDRLQVRLNTTGSTIVGVGAASVGDFTTLLLDINPTYTATGYPTAWTEFTLTLSGLPPAGSPGRIAFRYFVENAGLFGTNSDFIGIDDVSYNSTTPGGPPTTCTGSTANLKVDISGGNAPYTVVIGATPGAPGYPRTITGYTSGDYIAVTPPVTTTYNLISVTTADGCPGTGNSGTPTVTVSPTVVTPITIIDNPTGPLCAGNPKLLTVVGAATPGTCTTNSGVISVPVPDSDPNGTTSTINVSCVPAGATGTGASVNFTMTHTWDSDMSMFLKAPNGQVLNLVDRVGGSGDNFTNTTINSTSTNSLALGAAPFTGTFAPSGNLASPPPAGFAVTAATFAPLYNTTNLNGAWVFGMRDNAGGDLGLLTNWNITLNYAIPAGPPTGYTFIWTPSAGLSSTTTNPVAASPMTTTTYTVMGTAPSGCQTTAAITINVNQLPAITSQPTNVTACAGSTATFSAAGTGAGLTYQWQVSTNGGGSYANIPAGAPYTGTTSPTLTINPVAVGMNNNLYRLVLSGTCSPTANSTGALLTVNSLPVVTITPAGPVCGGTAGVNGTLLSTASSAPPVPGTVTVNSATINLAVPDNTANGVSNDITMAGIPANATITNVSITLNMSHTYPGDMIFNLKAPNGQILNLYKYGGGLGTGPVSGVPTWGWYGAKVSQLGTIAWSTVAAAPFIYNNSTAWKADAINTPVVGVTVQNPTGFISAAANFNALYTTGPSANGTWTLAMADGGAGDVGSLASWGITIDYTTPGGTGTPLTYTWSPATGLYTNSTATTPYVAGSQTPSVYAAPTVNTIYTATGTNGTTGCTNTATVSVIYTPPAPEIRPAAPAICLGSIQQLSIGSSLQAPVAAQFCSGPISVAIPEGNFPAPPTTAGVSTIPVSIPAGNAIQTIRVTTNITHNYVGDVVMVLKAPNGQVFNLDAALSATNNPGANFVNTVISSTGTAALSSGTAPFTATFKADAVGATFSAFGATLAGGPVGYAPTTTSWSNLYSVPSGNWTLALYDLGAPDVGILTSWCIDMTYAPATPAIWTPNGPGGTLYTDATATTLYTGAPAITVYAMPSVTTTYSATVSSVGPDALQTFTNAAPIAINDGNGNPYPANLAVTGLPTTGASVKTVTLTGISHTWSDDIDILLQSPTGQNVILMSDVGAANNLNNVTYTFDDAGGPLNAGPTGTYHPTNIVGAIGVEPDNWPAPGPGAFAQVAPALALFGNTANVNGTWKLFVEDDAGGDVGNIAGGFSIQFAYPTAGCPSPARTVTVTVNNPAVINTQPVNTSVCTDKVATFTVAATGTALTYQWQVSTNNGNTFTNISNGGVYSGATTATLVITAPPVSMNGYAYRVVVQGALPCPSATSFFRVLTVNPLPTVVISASPYTRLFPGLTTTLTSTVTPFAAGAGGYVWLRNGLQVAGANTGTLNVTVDGLGDYRLRVTDVNGCTNTSNTISITDSASGRCFIYPNPSNGVFQVRFFSALNNVLPRSVVVYDAKGDQILVKSYIVGRPYDRMDVDLRRNGKGLYWVEVVDVNGKRLTMCRVIIQ